MKHGSLLFLGLGLSLTTNAQHISEFISVNPLEVQDQYVTIPESHAFQLLFQAGDPLTEGGDVGVWSDFTGYLPIDGSSEQGYLCVNSEFVPGGVSVHDMQFNSTTNLWDITSSGSVDFDDFSCNALGFIPLPGTVINCSGGITPWGTVVTSEELSDLDDVQEVIGIDIPGIITGSCQYEDYEVYGWNIEFDPATRTVMDYDNSGSPDKVWGMGRMRHENACFTADSATSFFGEDNSASGYLFKYEMDEKANLSSGDLFVYVLDPQALTGTWVQVPNQTKDDKNNTIALAANLGATAFDRIEDVEIGIDDKIYFSSTGANRVYRLNQDGTGFEIYVDNQDFDIGYGTGTKTVRFSSPDNLVFDDLGNLWVNQDGGNNYLWVIGAGHSTQNPDVRIFANTPRGCESTGTTFTPDFKYMFVSIQHPEQQNSDTQTDVADQNVIFNRDATLVVALNSNLGAPESVEEKVFKGQSTYIGIDGMLHLSFYSLAHGKSTIELFDLSGKLIRSSQLPVHVGKNNFVLSLDGTSDGGHIVRVTMGDQTFSKLFVK